MSKKKKNRSTPLLTPKKVAKKGVENDLKKRLRWRVRFNEYGIPVSMRLILIN